MYNLETILEQWKVDSVIDELRLDETTIKNSKLHSKYIEYYAISKRFLKGLELKNQMLLKDKWIWYNGKMDKARMDELGWSYDPLDRMVVIKGNLNYFYDADPDLQKASARIEETKILIETLKEILDNIKWKHQSIRNIITWRQFDSGA